MIDRRSFLRGLLATTSLAAVPLPARATIPYIEPSRALVEAVDWARAPSSTVFKITGLDRFGKEVSEIVSVDGNTREHTKHRYSSFRLEAL